MSPDDNAEIAEIADEPELARRVAEARPDGDRLTRAVWFARVSAALFGEAALVTVGRYRLERQLGRGGGGSVFVARDPELHRDVAVKLIRCASERHRRRALAEARALAKLSHPNVVPVHDVGETAEHVYLVMELLRGESLRGYAAHPGRRVRDLVAAYRQAASGLAAAHAVGLIHRDFKPDNAVFGDDGRLRVVDFGLAAGDVEGDEGAAPAGTPRYMAPEQRAGGAVEAAVDQYAVGVALREAVAQTGRAEPAWLGRVIARVTAARPGDRYPSMEALSRALGRDPRTLWSRRALFAAPVVLAAVGFGLGRAGAPAPAEVCGGGSAALAPAWTIERALAGAAHIERLGTAVGAAAAPRVRARARERGEAWLTAHRASCAAHARGELSDELYDRATVCLARTRAGIAETMRLLETADA
ncbi:MAG TPA: serine/threonine-protein kinase, partial [Kofleriaceae bacterium]|nr:serine/threonine-protein kinase [Kofleriaceae bacterium]